MVLAVGRVVFVVRVGADECGVVLVLAVGPVVVVVRVGAGECGVGVGAGGGARGGYRACGG